MAPSPDSSPATPPPWGKSTTPPHSSSSSPPPSSPPPPKRTPPPPSKSPPPPAKSPPPPAKSPPPPEESPPPPPPAVKSPPPLAKSPPPPEDPEPPPSSTSTAPSANNRPSPPKSLPPASKHSSPTKSTSTDKSSPSGSLPTENSAANSPIATANSASFSSKNGGNGTKYGLAFGILAAVLVIAFMMAVMYIRWRRRKQRYKPYIFPSPASQVTGGNDSGSEYNNLSPSPGKVWFTYEQLSTATNGFSSQNVLGSGGFGCVYMGYLQDGREVAVKKLKAGGGQGEREFKAEVETISRVHHRHLVTLVGYCIKEDQRLLVYEFVPNNTLHHHLHGCSQPGMGWSLRLKVASGSAKGIAYLHEGCHPRIIHRDIKSANILLDNKFEAKVADFGLAKLAEELEGNTHVSTRVMGTFGYMAPEYASSGKLTEKSDVFSFGVVLLELITGRKPVDESQPLGDESLVEWARPLMTKALDTEDFEELVDPKLEGNYVSSEMFRMIEAAAACVRHSSSRRPKMSQVVRALDSAVESSTDLSNGLKPGQSEIFDSRQQSAQIRMFQRMAFESEEFSSDYTSNQASWSSGSAGGH